MGLKLKSISLKDANAFVEKWHRHHKKVQGHKYSVAAESNGEIVGVVIVGRPVSRHRDDGDTFEVTRLCAIEKHHNVCSFLYGAAARVAKNLGYRHLITYILNTEYGSTLEAAGWKRVWESRGGSWSRSNRPREDKHPIVPKIMYEKWV